MDMIEKGTATLCREQEQPYTTFANSTLALLYKNQCALTIYVYLQTKPSNWVIRASDIKNVLDIGRDKYRHAIRFLKDVGLFECRAIHDASGKFVDNHNILHYTPVHNAHTESLKTRPSVENHREPENPTAGKPTPLVIKDSLVIKDLRTKTCASGDTPKFDHGEVLITKTTSETMFEFMWERYHYKKHRKRAETEWLKITKPMTMNQYFVFAEKMIQSLKSKNRENAIGWSNTLLSSYLHGECWNDEATSTQPVKQALDMAARFPATMTQFLSGAWSRISDMDQETQMILRYGIENGLIKKEENLNKLTHFGFMRGTEQ